MGLHGATSPGLALDGFHGCGVEGLLGGRSARVSRVPSLAACGLSLCVIYVMDGHQEAVVHYLEAL